MNGKQLREKRRALGLTQNHLSKATGVSQAWISRSEACKTINLVDSEELKKVRAYLDNPHAVPEAMTTPTADSTSTKFSYTTAGSMIVHLNVENTEFKDAIRLLEFILDRMKTSLDSK